MICDICTVTAETKRVDIPFRDSNHANLCIACITSLGRIAVHMRTCSSRTAKVSSSVGSAAHRIKIAKRQFVKDQLLREGD